MEEVLLETLTTSNYSAVYWFSIGVIAGIASGVGIIIKIRPAPLKRNAKGKFQKRGSKK